jgi:hypothetical protein
MIYDFGITISDFLIADFYRGPLRGLLCLLHFAATGRAADAT